MTATSFWSADGTPMSAAQFLESLYGALPEFFKDEDELRAIWSDPGTRKALLMPAWPTRASGASPWPKCRR
jgi:type I restriction enzyme R subunit